MGDSSLQELRRRLFAGGVIPAHPLALTESGRFDPARQRLLTRYYLEAGAAGVAVGVHTTQFAIREPEIDLLAPVLGEAISVLDPWERDAGFRPLRIAGVCGRTVQACAEAEMARSLGYDAGLLSLSAYGEESEASALEHCRRVAGSIPLFGFYLQPAVGGRRLSEHFWREFCEIPEVVAIKVAPFDRYATLEVLRAVAVSGRAKEIALFTGNDDAIGADLMTPFAFDTPWGSVSLRFVGGLLGQWSVGTRAAVSDCAAFREAGDGAASGGLMGRAARITEVNAALFDAAHGFSGCIAGIQYILWRQGLLRSPRTLDPNEHMSSGQEENLDALREQNPDLFDEPWLAERLSRWREDYSD